MYIDLIPLDQKSRPACTFEIPAPDESTQQGQLIACGCPAMARAWEWSNHKETTIHYLKDVTIHYLCMGHFIEFMAADRD